MINQNLIQMCMISSKLFNDIKEAHQVLVEKIKYDKKHYININKDVNFAKHSQNTTKFPLFKVLLIIIPLQQATNIYIYNENHGNNIYLRYHDRTQNLNIKQMLKIINKLLKLGRIGIAKRTIRNAKIIWQINNDEARLNLK